MQKRSKPIRLSEHARERIEVRGATEEEVVSAINSAEWIKSELGRMECQKDFEYNQSWNKKHFKTKQVRPIFAEEESEITVITVYVYYF